MAKIGGLCILLAIGAFGFYERARWMETPPLEPSAPGHPTEDLCLKDCSATETGYTWASLHKLSDESDCDETASGREGSAGFAAGCKAFVRGEDPPAH